MSMQERVCDLARELQARPQVLVIEDNRDDVFLIQHALENQGCEVLVEHDGICAAKMFENCRHEPFDIIFLDLKLPGKNGVEVLKAAHDFMPRTPVVVITGFPESPMVHDAANLGFVELAAKPLTEETITRIFQTHRIRLPQSKIGG